MIDQKTFELFCNEGCAYKDYKQEHQNVWRHMEPCLNCMVMLFIDWLDGEV